MKNSIAYLFFCIILIACQSKTNTDNTKIKKDENRAFIEITKEQKKHFRNVVEKYERINKLYKYREIVEYTHPLVIKRLMDLNNIDEKMAKDALAKEMEKSLDEIKKTGIFMKSREITKFSDTFVKYNNAIYTSYQTITTLEVQGKPASILETVITVSKDNGNMWYFIDKNGNATGKHILLQEIDEETFNVL